MPLIVTTQYKRSILNLPSLTLWLDADQLSLSDTDSVASWTDVSGNGNHATQGTGSNQPEYRTDIVNGKSVVRFSGTTKYLTTPSFLLNTSGAKGTIFIVSKETATAGLSGSILNIRNKSPSDDLAGWGIQYRPADSPVGIRYYHTSKSPTLETSVGIQFTLFEVRRDGLDIETGINGNLNSPISLSGFNSSTSGDFTGTRIGRHWNSDSQFQGDIAEIILFETNLSNDHMSFVENTLMKKYNIS